MCGRFTLKARAEALAEQFDLPDVTWFEPGSPLAGPRYNIAPTQPVAVVRPAAAGGNGRELAALRWGLIPSWAADPGIGNRLINARAETVAEEPASRAASRRRCPIPRGDPSM